jgi:hypothetical protein
MPITEIGTSGRVRHMRPLPSDSTTQTVPVSATAKFTPPMPTLAARNLRRRWRRAASASTAGSSVSPLVSTSSRRLNSSRISARFLWMAGTRMWEGRSWPSCTISSARSVSTASTPAVASAWLRPVSSVVSDLTLMTSPAPWDVTSPATIRLHSAASRAQWTRPPIRSTLASSCSR